MASGRGEDLERMRSERKGKAAKRVKISRIVSTNRAGSGSNARGKADRAFQITAILFERSIGTLQIYF
jgi:hypothetical protein